MEIQDIGVADSGVKLGIAPYKKFRCPPISLDTIMIHVITKDSKPPSIVR
jgi:hypothetical protein